MCAILIQGFLFLLNYFFSLFNSVSVMRDLKKLLFYSFACCPSGLERLLTGEFLRSSLVVLLIFSVFW
jgi:hypothetical protein